MIKGKHLQAVGRRRFLGITAGALATAQVATNQIAKARPVLEASGRGWPTTRFTTGVERHAPCDPGRFRTQCIVCAT